MFGHYIKPNNHYIFTLTKLIVVMQLIKNKNQMFFTRF